MPGAAALLAAALAGYANVDVDRLSPACPILANRGGRSTAEAPVIGIDFFNRDMGPLRRLVQYALQGLGYFLDDLGLLFRGGPFTGDADADERHGTAPV